MLEQNQFKKSNGTDHMDQTLAREIKQARKIQMKLLNARKPELNEGEISGVSIPARLIGGDYFDFHTLPSGNVRIVIGDVMGKGIPAAMLMILTRGVFRSSAEHLFSPSDTLEAMNEAMYSDLRTLGSFVTLLCADWNPKDQTLTYASAGHNLPIIIDQHLELKNLPLIKGVMLGGLPNTKYQEKSVRLADEDLIFFYTDGIIEAQSEKGELFKIDRLVNSLRKYQHLEAEQIEEAIQLDVKSFTNGVLQKDDITMVVVKMKRIEERLHSKIASEKEG
ncbi:PP2C family protein-serine/threonine phosphatase [Gracilibacillus massiliensis]|uniref:PP2C family protein-serine/threonine phosphatase n=1 Tax=Gracilibacillus massiliensis TaxID=1564956 RepID=UPI000A727F54|nr:PP2C family protein-serine/threonine phosphatase [Gracilibacillus massiliensis]